MTLDEAKSIINFLREKNKQAAKDSNEDWDRGYHQGKSSAYQICLEMLEGVSNEED